MLSGAEAYSLIMRNTRDDTYFFTLALVMLSEDEAYSDFFLSFIR